MWAMREQPTRFRALTPHPQQASNPSPSVDQTDASTMPIQSTAGSSNPVASIMLQWHRIRVAVVLSSVLEQE